MRLLALSRADTDDRLTQLLISDFALRFREDGDKAAYDADDGDGYLSPSAASAVG